MKAPVKARRAMCFASSIGPLHRSMLETESTGPATPPTMPSVPRFVPNMGLEPVSRSGRESPTLHFQGHNIVPPLCPSAHRSKALPVIGRAHAQASLKEATKDFGAGEAAPLGDGLELILAILKSTARCIEAGAFYKNAGRRTRLSLEVEDEIALTHMHSFCKRFNCKISIEVVENPTLQFGDRPVAIELGCEMSAELRLAPGALEEQHQQPGGCKCHVATEIVLHQRQGEIHPSGHASGRVEAAVSQKDRIGIDLDRRIAPRQLIAEGPMRPGAATIQQAGFREQENAGADSAHPANSSGGLPEPVDTRPGG